MGATALWSAARYRLPLLVVVANNRTYLNDEIHQERVARARARPVENRWVGQRIARPRPRPRGARALARACAGSARSPRAASSARRSRRPSPRSPPARRCVVDVHVARRRTTPARRAAPGRAADPPTGERAMSGDRHAGRQVPPARAERRERAQARAVRDQPPRRRDALGRRGQDRGDLGGEPAARARTPTGSGSTRSCRSRAGAATAAARTSATARSRPSSGRPACSRRRERIQVFATFHVPLAHPVLAAKMVATADHVSGGRFGLNIVAGWYTEELSMFGLTQREHDERYEVADEWAAGAQAALDASPASTTSTARYFDVPAGVLEPKPLQKPYPVIMNAGTSPAGRAFAAKHSRPDLRRPDQLRDRGAQQIAEIKQLARERFGREIRVFGRGHIVCRDTEDEARGRLRPRPPRGRRLRGRRERHRHQQAPLAAAPTGRSTSASCSRA